MATRPFPITVLRAFLPLAERNEVTRDIEAELQARCAALGHREARRWLWRQVVLSIPTLIRRGWWRGTTGFEPRANATNPGGPIMERLLLELRYAARRLRTRPTYTLLAVLTLSLGVGGMAAISGIARALLVDPLPYRAPKELVDFWAGGDWRAREWLALRGQMMGFAGVSAYRHEDVTVERDGAPTRLAPGISATHELFDVLGVKPILGRGFATGEDAPASEKLVVLSYRLWKELGGSPSLVGTQVRLDGVQRTVIGVMPRGFWFPEPTIEAWINEEVQPTANYGIYQLVGRLAPGQHADNMKPALDRITQLLASQFQYSPRWDKTKNASLTSLYERGVSEMRPALLATLSGMAIILLIACANVAALVLSQVEARAGELAVRAALGADRSRLATQLFLEVLVLGVASGTLGTAFASVGFNVLRGALPLGAWGERATLDWRLFVITMVVGLGAAVLVALLPIIGLWRSDLRGTLSGSRTGGILRNRGGMQSLMVVGEVALAVLLAFGAGLLVRSVSKLYTIHSGVDTRGVAVLDIATPAKLGSADRMKLLHDLTDKLRGLPGVELTAVTQKLPLRGPGWSSGVNVPGAPADAPGAYLRIVSKDYFKALGIPLRRGRMFEASDATTDTIMSIVVNEAFVKVYFPGVEPLGQFVPSNMARGQERIVGVVANVAEANLKDEMAPTRYMLTDNIQFVADAQTIVMRTTRPEDAVRVLPAARQLVFKTAPNVAVQEATTMARVLDRAVGPAREVMTLLALLTGLSLVLGAIGIYGVISQFVSRRQRDWGIRVALGLAPQRVVTLVVRHGTTMVAVGIVAGVVIAVGVTRLLSGFLYGVTATDPIAMIGAAAVLLAVGVVAALIPALRASRTDPAIVLRES
jgi:predicted permease